jgi:hypothetical protein
MKQLFKREAGKGEQAQKIFLLLAIHFQLPVIAIAL